MTLAPDLRVGGVGVGSSSGAGGTPSTATATTTGGAAATRTHIPLTLQPNALSCKSFDIIPYVLAVHPCGIYSMAATTSMRWIFTGSEDGYIRKYDFFASMNGKTPLTQGQRHGQVESVTKAGILTSYWENEEQPNKSLPQLGEDGLPIFKMDVDSVGSNTVTGDGIVKQEGIKHEEGSGSTSNLPPLFPTVRASSPDLESKMSAVYSLDCHSEALFALSGLESGAINLWTPRHEEGTCHHVFRQHTSPVSAIKITPNQEGFISGSWDQTILQWDLNTGSQVRHFNAHGSQISSLQFQPLGIPLPSQDMSDPMANVAIDGIMLSTSVDGSMFLWDRREANPIPRCKMSPNLGTPPWCLSACWSADGQRIYCGRRNGTVDEYDFASGKLIQTIKMPANSGPVSFVKSLPNNKHIVCASQDNIRLWNVTELETKSSLRPFQILAGHHGGLISSIHIDPTCKYMITTSGNREWEGPSTNACLFYDILTQD